MNSRIYFLKCTQCGGTEFSFEQQIDKSNKDTWHSIELDKTLCHSGFGWELEDFTPTCTKCKGHDVEVEHRENKEEK